MAGKVYLPWWKVYLAFRFSSLFCPLPCWTERVDLYNPQDIVETIKDNFWGSIIKEKGHKVNFQKIGDTCIPLSSILLKKVILIRHQWESNPLLKILRIPVFGKILPNLASSFYFSNIVSSLLPTLLESSTAGDIWITVRSLALDVPDLMMVKLADRTLVHWNVLQWHLAIIYKLNKFIIYL